MGKGPLVYPKSCIQLVAYGYRKKLLVSAGIPTTGIAPLALKGSPRLNSHMKRNRASDMKSGCLMNA